MKVLEHTGKPASAAPCRPPPRVSFAASPLDILAMADSKACSLCRSIDMLAIARLSRMTSLLSFLRGVTRAVGGKDCSLCRSTDILAISRLSRTTSLLSFLRVVTRAVGGHGLPSVSRIPVCETRRRKSTWRMTTAVKRAVRRGLLQRRITPCRAKRMTAGAALRQLKCYSRCCVSFAMQHQRPRAKG